MDGGNIVAWIGLALSIVAGLLGLLLYLTSQISQERSWREEADDKIAAELTAFRLEAIRTFATAGAIEKSEERLAVALDKVTARLETVIGRIEALGMEMARIVGPQNKG